uniref:Uncharacterized protein n=1 Tax=Setaria viridis TaxID=4556 RepID=A0A4U6V0S9_SETVI|nr:hypothetical protein SEVIR_4G241901v2 [Setaria viridis]
MTVDVNFGDLTGDSDAGSNQGTPGQPLHHFHSISPSTTSFVRSPFGSLQEKFEVSLFTPPLGITRSCHHTLTHRPSGRKLAGTRARRQNCHPFKHVRYRYRWG